jgi:hypothetical protein
MGERDKVATAAWLWNEKKIDSHRIPDGRWTKEAVGDNKNTVSCREVFT